MLCDCGDREKFSVRPTEHQCQSAQIIKIAAQVGTWSYPESRSRKGKEITVSRLCVFCALQNRAAE